MCEETDRHQRAAKTRKEREMRELFFKKSREGKTRFSPRLLLLLLLLNGEENEIKKRRTSNARRTRSPPRASIYTACVCVCVCARVRFFFSSPLFSEKTKERENLQNPKFKKTTALVKEIFSHNLQHTAARAGAHTQHSTRARERERE